MCKFSVTFPIVIKMTGGQPEVIDLVLIVKICDWVVTFTF